MDKTPFQENKKYRDLIGTARDLFFKHGTKRITIEEICEKADVSKVTFYKFFRNKEEILKSIMQLWVDQHRKETENIMNRDAPFIDKIELLIKLHMEKTQEYSDDFFEEIIGSDENIKNFLVQKNIEVHEQMLNFYRQGQEEGYLRKNLNPQFYIYLMEHFVEMMNDERLKAVLPDPHDRFEELMNFYFFGFNETDRKL